MDPEGEISCIDEYIRTVSSKMSEIAIELNQKFESLNTFFPMILQELL